MPTWLALSFPLAPLSALLELLRARGSDERARAAAPLLGASRAPDAAKAFADAVEDVRAAPEALGRRRDDGSPCSSVCLQRCRDFRDGVARAAEALYDAPALADAALRLALEHAQSPAPRPLVPLGRAVAAVRAADGLVLRYGHLCASSPLVYEPLEALAAVLALL